jgi:hypothetical protein
MVTGGDKPGRWQFSLWSLFLLTYGVAFVCGLASYIGWAPIAGFAIVAMIGLGPPVLVGYLTKNAPAGVVALLFWLAILDCILPGVQ